MERIFAPIGEKEVTRAIVEEFYDWFVELAEVDVIIVGGGPSGLIAGKDLAEKGVEVLLLEQNNYLGGGFWLGGFLMNKLTVREPAQEFLEELNVPYREVSGGLYTASAPHACSALIASACEAGVNILNMTYLEDVVFKDDKVAGAVINWYPVKYLPRAISMVDPISIESQLVIDATGHDAQVVSHLERMDLLVKAGEKGMWIEKAEDMLVNETGEVYPGVLICGMAVAAVIGLPRMGPTFGAMFVSGRKVAEVALDILE